MREFLMNNVYLKSLLILGISSVNYSLMAGELSQDQISVDLMQLTRDSNNSVTYLYDNGGTVNSPGDDTVLSSTGDFNKADLGYRLSGSKKVSEKWSFHAGLISMTMDSASSFNSSGQLEIFQLAATGDFDAAHTVQANYSSEMAGEEINAIYQYNDSIDYIIGISHLNIDEQFKIISDDTGNPGVGTYTIDTGNDMMGVQIGVAVNHKTTDKISFYALGKVGFYDNSSNQIQTVTDSALNRSNNGTESGSSTITDVKLGMKYHYSKQIVMNLDYQLINISNVTLAESHFDTTFAGSNAVINSDDLKWSGFNLGLTYMF